MTQIEEFLFQKLNRANAAPFLRALSYRNQTVIAEIVSFPDQTSRIEAMFANATIDNLSFDTDESFDWPCDVIGFDAYELSDRHRWPFVLHCTELEWVWSSDWPVVSVAK